MKTISTLLFSLFLLLNINLLGQVRGTIVSVSEPTLATPVDIMSTLSSLPLDDLSLSLIDLITYKKYSVAAVKIIYNTIDGQGNPTTASGVVFLPFVATPTPMPMFSYLHGTLTSDLDVPSMLFNLQAFIGWIMAMDGYIAVLPDYIGLGDGPGFHPFSHADSEASASVDMLKAAYSFCLFSDDINAKPDGNLYLSGYSQGAHAALATQREIEKNPIPGLSLRKTVAGSGAYSLSYIQKKFLFNYPEYPNPSFLPYILLGYQEVYGNLYSNLNQVFVSPYNSIIPAKFNRILNVEQIDSYLPVTWQSMFVPHYLWNIKYRYFHPVNEALRDNDLIKWKPKNDLHLYYCTCDELVAKENSLLAYLSFLLRGSRDVTCLPLGPFNHNDCAPFVMMLAKIQFDCASGTNPCGLNLADLLNLNKSASDLSMFKNALVPNKTLDVNEVMQDKNLVAYLDEMKVKNTSLNIYPNPASELVMLEMPTGSVNYRLHLYDVMGRLVRDVVVTTNSVQLDVRNLQPGLYKVIINGNHNLNGSFMVVR